jgi:hypothetical protein
MKYVQSEENVFLENDQQWILIYTRSNCSRSNVQWNRARFIKGQVTSIYRNA